MADHRIDPLLQSRVPAIVYEVGRAIRKGDSPSALLDEVVVLTRSTPLVNLSRWEDLIRYALYGGTWSVSHRAFPSLFVNPFKPKTATCWLDICSGDGYRREAAAREFQSSQLNPLVLSLLFRRLNDHVPQVRSAAVTQLHQLLPQCEPEVVSEALVPLLLRWHTWSRVSSAEESVILEAISLPPVFDSLKQMIIESPVGPMALLLTQVGRIDAIDAELFNIARSAIQPSVRLRAYRAIVEGRMTWNGQPSWLPRPNSPGQVVWGFAQKSRELTISHDVAEVLSAMVRDKAAMVRAVAGDFVVMHRVALGKTAKELAEVLAADRASRVVERGRYLLDTYFATLNLRQDEA